MKKYIDSGRNDGCVDRNRRQAGRDSKGQGHPVVQKPNSDDENDNQESNEENQVQNFAATVKGVTT
jgi:hypothetical protein